MDPEAIAGRYTLVRTIGKGATGNVWEAVDTLLHRAVAIKIVDLAGARDPATAERFRREGVAIAGVNHPAIVQVYDTGADDARGWLVMELLTGPNLNTLVKQRGPVSFAVGMPLLAEVASGLQAAHDAGITHRDVKPANIVLHAQPDADGTLPDLLERPELGHPVLVDFGIARLVDESGTQLTRPATAIGTAAYMSPEQARGQIVGPASDVYSLGCVLYYLFLGHPPFMADNSVAIAHSQAFDPPVPLGELSPDVPPALDTLVARMLAKDPSIRPTASEVSRELLAITADPRMAPTVTLPSGVGAAADLPVVDQDPLVSSDAKQATAETEAVTRVGGSAWRRPGRWLMGLLVVGLLAALVYSWVAPGRPQPSPTVTLTNTVTRTSSPMQTASRTPSSSVTPTDDTTYVPETTFWPTTEAPTQAPTTTVTYQPPPVTITTTHTPTEEPTPPESIDTSQPATTEPAG
ncbi:hypothetical protein GCM10009785_12860 [Brooklawnia cerclae]|uniref:non-specific serine/threonine protein kinase n=1 Tax=Brooklawnia cerclae TaxID=349934 RepID=A0ABX0SLI4_9ACTN|nr:serine/threonine-protein kinase [Brooklawnia cerclae]NIH58799.1 serine/threonine-protein kinase [Brooklawnia cerclae]